LWGGAGVGVRESRHQPPPTLNPSPQGGRETVVRRTASGCQGEPYQHLTRVKQSGAKSTMFLRDFDAKKRHFSRHGSPEDLIKTLLSRAIGIVSRATSKPKNVGGVSGVQARFEALIASSTACATSMSEVSITTASAAATSGAVARVESRASRDRMSASTSS
jgi:hypothetical protein